MAQSDGSWRRSNSVAVGGIAEIVGKPTPVWSGAFDPTRTEAAFNHKT
jgi:hypothetical protein